MPSTQTPQEHARQIADHVIAQGLNIPSGGVIERRTNAKNKTYYRIGFSTPTQVDGEVNIYNPGWILLWYSTSLEGLSGEHKVVFKGTNAMSRVMNFLSVAFVKRDTQQALSLMPS